MRTKSTPARIQRILNFSSQENKNVIENYSELLCATKGVSQSKAIEDMLLSQVYPKNSTARGIVKMLLFEKQDENAVYFRDGGLQRAVLSSWNRLASKVDNEQAEEDAIKLFQFQQQDLFTHKSWEDKFDENILYHFSNQVKYLGETLEHAAKIAPEKPLIPGSEIMMPVNYDRDIYELNRISKELLNEKIVYQDSLNFIFIVLREHWSEVCHNTYTYRLLVDITQVQTWADTREARLKFIDVLNNISINWKEFD